MRTLFEDEPEASDAVDEPTVPDLERRYRIYLFVGMNFVAYGLLLQWLIPTTTLRCEPPAAGIASCVANDSILLGLVSTDTEALAGVSGARIEVRKGIRRARDQNTHHIVLQTTSGRQRELTRSSSYVAAHRLAGTIKERLRADAAFEASLGFAFEDWAWRAFALLGMAGGAGLAAFAALALVGYRRSSATQP